MIGALEVTFMVNATKAVVTKIFDHPDKCRAFIIKAEHSKRITLISYPNLGY